MAAAIATACESSISPSAPGLMGTPASRASRRAMILSPICEMTLDDGPMNVSPSFSTASTNDGFSERKP